MTKDEFRRLNSLRAAGLAFAVVLALQWPLAWLLKFHPGPDPAMQMAACTWFLGFIAYLGAFLFFDRD